jgi:5-hmdU DNA kinase, helical domain
MPIVGEGADGLRRFFADARERYRILLARRAGRPAPWTKDPVMQGAYLCNVHREDDKVTTWFRQHVRDPLRDKPEVLLATVVFRWFTRISVGEAIFCAPDLENRIAFETLLGDERWNIKKKLLRKVILDHCGIGPYVTGAYIISTPPGMSKLDGVLENIKTFMTHEFTADGGFCCDWRGLASAMREGQWSLEESWRFLREVPYLGNFHAYEVVTDLRHTALLDRAPDVDTWANIGPGCRRGLRRVTGRDCDDDAECLRYMSKILHVSRTRQFWPAEWPKWEMRECEHQLCEWDKIERAREHGLGSLKRRYRHGGG